MALSRERIADELLKLLAMPDPAATVSIMLTNNILRAVIPEIETGAVLGLSSLIASERQAGIEADPVRRFAALLPSDPATTNGIGIRLRFSNKARKRLSCAGERTIGPSPQALAYKVGISCAVDRLLLNNRPRDAAEIASWHMPRLPIAGGALIKRGLAEGPVVARTLRTIEKQWVEAGFPSGDVFERIVAEALKAAH
jgi:poly(A) polymerase